MAYQDADFGGRKALPRYNAPGNSARAAVRGSPGVLDQALGRSLTRAGGQRDGGAPMWGHEGWLARGKVPVGATPRGTNAGAPSTGARPIAGIRNDSFGAQPGARPIAGSLGGFGGTPNRPPMQLPNIAPRPMAPWLQGAPGASLDPGRMQANGAPGAMGSILQRILGGGGAGGRPPVPGGGLQTGLTNPSSAPSGFWSGIQTPNSRGLGTPMPAGMGGQPTNFADLLGLGRPLQNYRPNPNVDYSRVPMY